MKRRHSTPQDTTQARMTVVILTPKHERQPLPVDSDASVDHMRQVLLCPQCDCMCPCNEEPELIEHDQGCLLACELETAESEDRSPRVTEFMEQYCRESCAYYCPACVLEPPQGDQTFSCPCNCSLYTPVSYWIPH
jgi:hypothetical protein